MKELFYQLYFIERDDIHNPKPIHFSVPQDIKLIDFLYAIKEPFDVGYDPDAVEDRDNWAEEQITNVCSKFGCTWEYLPIAGMLVVD